MKRGDPSRLCVSASEPVHTRRLELSGASEAEYVKASSDAQSSHWEEKLMSILDNLGNEAKELAEKAKELGEKAKDMLEHKDELLAKGKEQVDAVKEKASHLVDQGRDALKKD